MYIINISRGKHLSAPRTELRENYFCWSVNRTLNPLLSVVLSQNIRVSQPGEKNSNKF